MNLWNRKRQRIEFFHNDPGIVDNFPIIESKDLKLNWVKRTKENFQKLAKEGIVKKPGFIHLSRCPGIFDLFKYGYIIPLHKDIAITPKGKEFDCWTSGLTDQIKSDFRIGTQNTELITKPPWAADFIIKIDTGWHVIAPKDLKFLMLPIAYPDTFDFTSTIGILNPAQSTKLNFQLFWNATEPETIIKAGTPLGHLIPLTEKKYAWVQRTMNQKDRDWLEKDCSLRDSTFWSYTIRSKLADMYNKY